MTHSITRRKLLAAASFAGLGTTIGSCAQNTQTEVFSAARSAATGRFTHGIASGDPLQTAVILWTRITPDDQNGGPVTLTWELSPTQAFAEEGLRRGTITASAASDWTAKVDATGLRPGQLYYYRFTIAQRGQEPQAGEQSPVGQTRTLPEGPLDTARFAVVSCANWQHGFFNAYDHIARQDGFDAVIHLGDYFYEYGAQDTLNAGQGRLHEPRHEIISLRDYRIRHAQYRTDSSLQAMSAKFPLITIWDDHESSNDSWQGGAENHSPDTEGSWDARKQAAMRAYYEWMPVRNPTEGKAKETLLRSLDFGDLITLVTVETRLTARAEPLIIEDHIEAINQEGGAEKFKAEVLGDASREMYGQLQEDFIVDTLTRSKERGQRWRVIANQVIMGRLLTPDLEPYVDEDTLAAIEAQWAGVRDMVSLSKHNFPVYPDSWDGYPAARERFYGRLKDADVRDIFVLTGDAHEFWVNDLTMKTKTQVGVEFVTTSVSSETLTAYMGGGAVDYALLLTQANEDARYYNAMHNGYSDITFTKDKARVKMIAVSDVTQQEYSASEVAAFTVRPDKGSLSVSSPKGLNLKQRALFNGLG